MNILFISKYFHPHIGGVETHALEVAKALSKKHSVVVVTDKYGKLRERENYKGIQIHRLKYPYVKFFGLIKIWAWFSENRKLIADADIIHIHDVFVWYLPFRFLYPFKKVYTTFHGWEGVWPIPRKNIFMKKVSAFLSFGKICVGKYVGKYYGFKPDYVTYGGGVRPLGAFQKTKGSVVFLGRLEQDTGVLQFIDYIKSNKFKKVTFVGDGKFRGECAKYGVVTGFVNPDKYLKSTEYCTVGGYLSYISAKNYGCKIITFADNPLKKDYWKEVKEINNFPSWRDVAGIYENLWGLV